MGKGPYVYYKARQGDSAMLADMVRAGEPLSGELREAAALLIEGHSLRTAGRPGATDGERQAKFRTLGAFLELQRVRRLHGRNPARVKKWIGVQPPKGKRFPRDEAIERIAKRWSIHPETLRNARLNRLA